MIALMTFMDGLALGSIIVLLILEWDLRGKHIQRNPHKK